MVHEQNEKERAKDKRLQRKFGITLERFNEIAREQKGRCAICGGPLDAYGPPAVDHFHFHVSAVRQTDPLALAASGMKWFAQAYDERRRMVTTEHAKTKEAALAAVKKVTMPWSVRGLLCFKCNRGLGCVEKFFNAAEFPDNLLPVIEYLKARLS